MTLPRWVVLTAGLLGCAHEAAAPAAPSADPSAVKPGKMPDSARYFPLAVGNHWTYAATYLGERSTRQVEVVSFRDGDYVDRDGRAMRVDREGVRDQVRYLLHEPATVTLSSDRSEHSPWGLAGGGPGRTANNYRLRADGKRVRLPSKVSCHVAASERVVIETPGGGGYGEPALRDPDSAERDRRNGIVR